MRTILSTIALAALASSCVSAPALGDQILQSECDATQSNTEAARNAYFFAFPVYEMARMRQQMLSRPGAGPNALLHRRDLSTPDDRSITTPNNDTLYSTAWLDLAAGPVRFSIPAMQSRYHSVELMDAFSDAFEILRNKGSIARTYLIVGPEWKGQAAPGETIVQSPTRDAWLVGRTFVRGRDDLASAQRLQMAYRIKAVGGSQAGRAPGETIPSRPSAGQFLAVVNANLARGALPEVHERRLSCFARVGVLPGEEDALAKLDPAMRPTWDENLSEFFDQAKLAFEEAGTFHNGWRYPAANLAQFGTDDVYRTATALAGLAALPTSEAMNPVTMHDGEGRPLSGASRNRLRIPGSVPVDGFWSLTLYESDGAGRWFLYENLADRYAISSTSEGIIKDVDGSITLDISHEKPVVAANWLPAPSGRFLLVFRAYRPKRAMIDGTFLLPPVQTAGT